MLSTKIAIKIAIKSLLACGNDDNHSRTIHDDGDKENYRNEFNVDIMKTSKGCIQTKQKTC